MNYCEKTGSVSQKRGNKILSYREIHQKNGPLYLALLFFFEVHVSPPSLPLPAAHVQRVQSEKFSACISKIWPEVRLGTSGRLSPHPSPGESLNRSLASLEALVGPVGPGRSLAIA